MEQRKVLLIIVSVSVVLAVTIGVGLWLFYPRDDTAEVAAARQTGGLEWEPLDFLQGLGERPGLDRVPADNGATSDGSFEVTYGVTPPDTRSGEGPARTTDASAVAARTTDQPRVAIDTIPPPTAAPTTSAAGSASAAGSVAPTPTQPRTPTPGPAPAVAARPVTTAAAVVVPTPATPGLTPQASALSSQAYWVQVISSPNRDTAEQAQLTLKDRQLGTRIMTREINGVMYYRLRLGPFALRTEAEKFLDWVLELSQFSDAMIFVDYSTPVIDPARS